MESDCACLGGEVQLTDHTVRVCRCEDCGAKMVWANQRRLTPDDLTKLKSLGLRLSNPNTSDHVCVSCEIEREDRERDHKRRLNDWMTTPSHSDSSSSFFGGGMFSGFGGGGFGGFGGGSFSGGGASGGF